MKKEYKFIIIDIIYMLLSIIIFTTKCFPYLGIGIIVLGIILFYLFNK